MVLHCFFSVSMQHSLSSDIMHKGSQKNIYLGGLDDEDTCKGAWRVFFMEELER